MAFNPFKQAGEETSFEQGLTVNKTIKNVSDAAKKQAAQTTKSIVAQLYGLDESQADSSDQNSDPNKNASPQSKPVQASSTPNAAGQFPGLQTPDELARYQNLQAQLKGEGRSDDEVKMQTTHSTNYFRPTIGNVDDEIQNAARVRSQKDQQRKQMMEEEEQQKKQAEAESNAEIPRPMAKGRNRMGQGGKKPKTDMGLKMGQMKTETFRGSSG